MTAEDHWRREVFRRYARERREVKLPAYTVHPHTDVTRHYPRRGEDEAMISFAAFDAAVADARIDEELANLRAHGWEGEWKVHGLDEPCDLKARLEARGLRAHHEEALLMLDVDAATPSPIADGDVAIAPAHGPLLDAIAAFQERVWDIRLPWLAAAMHEMADPRTGTALVYCAVHRGEVVGSGWIDFHGGSAFAQLCGGAVLEPYRGRGVYSRLFARRLVEAKARGVRWIAVDAAPMSRPILEKKGFRFVCATYPMRTKPYDAGPVTRG